MCNCWGINGSLERTRQGSSWRFCAASTTVRRQVIQALEQLERLSVQREQEAATVLELRRTVERLEADKAERSSERAKFEKVGVPQGWSWTRMRSSGVEAGTGLVCEN